MQPPIERNEDLGEFADLLSSIGAAQETHDVSRVLAFKQMEIETLRKHLQDLRSLGTNLAEIEKRFLAENGVLELEVATLQLALEVANSSAQSHRSIARTRRKALVARLRESLKTQAKATARTQRLEQSYRRRREDITKLRENGQELRRIAKERNTELRDLRSRLRAAETPSKKKPKR